ncbi:inositol monophosphatase family protein [Rathayibacter soli]|uniref:inositol monophosphatase family protein n=1 Tax=Rathayibacter soli TaxID=3144168 RepID=UPI0027E40714|nr:inositol monophosphatase family protein [Glaciibacter superstes]
MTANRAFAFRTGVAAHRGDSSRFRENTLPAIRSAIEAGAEFVEIDVRVTSDGTVIVLHDPTLERLWGLPLDVTEVTVEQVRALGDADNRPPLLTEVLAEFAGSGSTLLIDMDEAAPAEAAFRVTVGSDIQIAWCGDLNGMRIIRSLDPHARIWMPWDHPYAPTRADLALLAPERVNSPYLAMTHERVDAIHALDCKVAVWTVDDELTMRWVLGLGVDTVTTNRLARLQRIVGEGPSDQRARTGASIDGVDLDAALVVARGLAEWEIDFTSSTDPGQISTKKDAADLVTEVDVAVERQVREVIGLHFPDHDFVGEEMGGSARAGVPCWYLDPVDGTANFANRIPWNAFSLGLVLDGTPMVGVVADPWRADLFEAVRGRGAKLNGSVLTIPTSETAEDPLSGRILSTELANQVPWPGMLQLLEKLGERYCTMRVMGSGTMTLVGVAAGRGVGAVIGKYGPEDHVAAALIVKEAGGVVLDSTGAPNLFPASGGIMAASPEAAQAVFDLWRASREEAGASE